MRRQRNMAQMKEQNKTSEKELSKMETSNLLDAEFETLVIRMLKAFSGDFISIKKQTEIKDTLIKIKNNLQQQSPTFLAPRSSFSTTGEEDRQEAELRRGLGGRTWSSGELHLLAAPPRLLWTR